MKETSSIESELERKDDNRQQKFRKKPAASMSNRRARQRERIAEMISSHLANLAFFDLSHGVATNPLVVVVVAVVAIFQPAVVHGKLSKIRLQQPCKQVM